MLNSAQCRLDILLRDGKTEQLEVKTQETCRPLQSPESLLRLRIVRRLGCSEGASVLEEPADGFREWWEKAILAAPRQTIRSDPHPPCQFRSKICSACWRDGPLQLRTNQSLGLPAGLMQPSIAISLLLTFGRAAVLCGLALVRTLRLRTKR